MTDKIASLRRAVSVANGAKRANQAMTAHEATFLVVSCLDTNRLDSLVLAIERDRVTIGALNQALQALGAEQLAKALAAASERLRRTPLHEIFRSASWKRVQWCLNKLAPHCPPMMRAREPGSLATPLHVFAQRMPEEADNVEYWTFFVNAFLSVDNGVLQMKDSGGLTPLQYLAMLSHARPTYELIVDKRPQLRACGSAAGAADALSPETLRADQLSHELKNSEFENRQLRRELEAQRDSYEMLAGEQERLKKSVATQHLKIRSLNQQLGESDITNQELTQKEIAYIGRSDDVKREIRELQAERDRALREAREAREQFTETAEELRAATEERRELQTDLRKARAEADERAADVLAAQSDREKLSAQMRRLADERDNEASRAGMTEEDKMRAEAKYRLELASFEEQLGELDEQLRAAEKLKQVAMGSIEEMESQLEERESEVAQLQIEFDGAKANNDRLQAELGAANERQLDMQRRMDELQTHIDELTEQQFLNDKRKRELETQADEERRLMQTELQSARSLLQEAEERATAEHEAAQAALAEIDDAAAKRAEAERIASREKETQRQLQEMRAEHELIMQRNREAEESAVAERAHMQQQLEQARRDLELANQRAQENFDSASQWSEYHETTISALKAERDAKEEALRLARQKLDEEQTMTMEARRQLEAQQMEISDLRREIEERLDKADSKKSGSATAGKARPSADAKSKRAGRVTIKADDGEKDGGSGGVDLMTPRNRGTLGRASTLRRVGGVSEERERELETMQHNCRVNEPFFMDIVDHTLRGDWQWLVEMFTQRKISPNTRCTKTHRVLLEVATRACSETKKAEKMMGPDGKLLVKRLEETMRRLIEHGAEWSGIDAFLSVANNAENHLTKEAVTILETRDDLSPFVQALLRNDPTTAVGLLDKIEDLDRIPALAKHEYEGTGFSFMHIAVLNAMKRGKSKSRTVDDGHGYPNETMVLMLVRNGADCNMTDNNERTPLHLALLKSKHIEREMFLRIVEYLLAGGADPEEICTYQKFIDMASGGETKKSVLAKVASKKKTVQEQRSEASSLLTKYGSPVKWAEARNDAPLLNLLKNRRYLRVSLRTLKEYIAECVKFKCATEALHAEGVTVDNDPFDLICKRYASVFQWFNPRFEQTHGRASVLRTLQKEAGVSVIEEEAESDAKLQELVRCDEFFLDSIAHCWTGGAGMSPTDKCKALGKSVPELDDAQQYYLENVSAPEAARVNDSYQWKVVSALKQFMKALTDKWFEVSDLVHGPAIKLYPEAAVAVLHDFVRDDRVKEMANMLGRSDRLYGDLDVDTIIYAEESYTALDLATHYGAISCQEWLMAHQRSRVNDLNVVGPSNMTLIAVAHRAQQPLSIVAIDHFRFQNGLCVDEKPNALSYGIVTPTSKMTALHESAQRGRDDLLRFCIDMVQHHLTAVNERGYTPLDLAREKLAVERDTVKYAAIASCVRSLESYEAGLDESDSVASQSIADKPPPPLMPPPALLVVPGLDFSGAGTVDSTGTESARQTPRSERRRRREEQAKAWALAKSDDEDDDTAAAAETPRSSNRRHRRHRHRDSETGEESVSERHGHKQKHRHKSKK